MKIKKGKYRGGEEENNVKEKKSKKETTSFAINAKAFAYWNWCI